MKKMLDLYSDYLLASFSQTFATGLSNLTNGEISHDQVTRFLSRDKKTGKDLWLIALADVLPFDLLNKLRIAFVLHRIVNYQKCLWFFVTIKIC